MIPGEIAQEESGFPVWFLANSSRHAQMSGDAARGVRSAQCAGPTFEN